MTTTTPTITALVIPVEGPLETVELATHEPATLKQLQDIVGGYAEPLPMPSFLDENGNVTIGNVIIDGEGQAAEPGATKPRNQRATDFMVPGIGIPEGDYIAGPAVLVGLGNEGENLSVQDEASKRARLIESESRVMLRHLDYSTVLANIGATQEEIDELRREQEEDDAAGRELRQEELAIEALRAGKWEEPLPDEITFTLEFEPRPAGDLDHDDEPF